MNFNTIPSDIIDLRNSYYVKYKNNRKPKNKKMTITKAEREAHSLYMILYGRQDHRKEKTKELAKKSRVKNRKKNSITKKLWVKNNPDKISASNKRYREKQKLLVRKL